MVLSQGIGSPLRNNLMSDVVFQQILFAWVLIAVAVFIALFFIAAPYGRYFRHSYGPSINGKFGWMIMEAPAPLVFAFFFQIFRWRPLSRLFSSLCGKSTT
jgi:hypothetical protein